MWLQGCGMVLFWALLIAGAPAHADELPKTSVESLRTGDGSMVQVEIGVLQVPESRVAPGPRRIGIPWYRLRSTAAHPAAPVFMLAGGPGASGIDALGRKVGWREIAFYQTFADVVVFDQRGAGDATPQLDCPQTAHYPDDIPLDRVRLRAMRQRLLSACRDLWLKAGVDLAAYNTIESAADVNDLRIALGYDKVNLVGGSYGSHLGLQVMRLYPKSVAQAVFYGIEGPDQTWDEPDGVLSALQRYDEASQALAPELGLQVPEGGYLASLARTIQSLQAKPERVVVERDGKPVTVVVDAEIVRLMARRFGAGSHDRPDAWPRMILALAQGDHTQAAKAALSYRELRLQDPMHWSMDCSSSVSAGRRARYAQSRASDIVGDLNAEYEDLCDVWPTRAVGDDYRVVTKAPIPTLLFHGTWDVSTPLENAREVEAGLSNGRLVVVEGGNHGVLYNLFGRWPPIHETLRRFLSAESVTTPAWITMPWVGKTAATGANADG